jgi:hypothetical protein
MEVQAHFRGDTRCERNQYRTRELSEGRSLVTYYSLPHLLRCIRHVTMAAVQFCSLSLEGRSLRESISITITAVLSLCLGLFPPHSTFLILTLMDWLRVPYQYTESRILRVRGIPLANGLFLTSDRRVWNTFEIHTGSGSRNS